MRFPGQRIAKHYFPVTEKARRFSSAPRCEEAHWYLVGLDQVLVDVEVEVPEGFPQSVGIPSGESVRLADAEVMDLLERVLDRGCPVRYAPGGTVANSLHNYCHLSGEPAVLLGVVDEAIRPGSPAFHYVARTPNLVDLSYLRAAPGRAGTAVTLIEPGGERSFAVAAGNSTAYDPGSIPEGLVERAAAVVTTLYTLEDPDWPIARATRTLMAQATAAGVPVAFGLGTRQLVARLREPLVEVLREHVTIAAMNHGEAEALTGERDPLLCCQKALEWVDLVIVTMGPRGLCIGGHVDSAHKRKTRNKLRSGVIDAYNRFEFSRLMRRRDCRRPVRVYTHIHPFRGGPDRVVNANGAGDAVLAAVLHDVAANRYHRASVPDSPKHRAGAPFLTYSSLSRNAQYGNRVAYEVLQGNSPRLVGPVGPDLPPRARDE